MTWVVSLSLSGDQACQRRVMASGWAGHLPSAAGAELLTVYDAGSWQLPEEVKPPRASLMVPALQEGFGPKSEAVRARTAVVPEQHASLSEISAASFARDASERSTAEAWRAYA